ncbi:MAG: HRDC domain-containing protein [Desulfamplus sp.]|nr:HRDC domain-containing protein [Desulfamplus sp.]
MIEYSLISSNEELKNQCKDIELHNKIAMDLEADSLHHFKERVCLVQMASSKSNYLVDPLTITDFSPLKPICENPSITKVFHGADFDIRSLDRDFDIKICNLFDTEIACRFLGIQKRSLAALLKKHFNLNLDKRFQKTDWSQRPLSKQMIEYSINDVAYLIELSEILREKLIDIGRLSWAMEEFELQTKVRYDKHEDTPLFTKFKGAGKMSKENLAVLESLLQMRAKIAEEKNIPLFKIISSESITTLALRKPKNMNELRQTNSLSPKQISMYGESCIKAVVRGIETKLSCKNGANESKNNINDNTRLSSRKKMLEAQSLAQDKVNELKNLRDSLSEKTGIESGFLLSNATIASVVLAKPLSEEQLLQINGIRKWQVDLIGKEVIKILYC